MRKFLFSISILFLISCAEDEGSGPVNNLDQNFDRRLLDGFMSDGPVMTDMSHLDFSEFQRNFTEYTTIDRYGNGSSNSITFNIDGYSETIPIWYCESESEVYQAIGLKSIANGQSLVVVYGLFRSGYTNDTFYYHFGEVFILDNDWNIVQYLASDGEVVYEFDLSTKTFESNSYEYSTECIYDEEYNYYECYFDHHIDEYNNSLFSVSVNGGC